MRILIIEDDDQTASYLRKGLNEAGYTVDRAKDGCARSTSSPGRTCSSAATSTTAWCGISTT